ncbi:MAG: oligosaccharide repeat unit polymerase [Mycobacterium sp.]|nr:oligosaccharide repeat unit polymerase [Mycobacterium sp.]
MRPVPVAATLLVFTILMAYYMTPASYLSNYREPKYVDGGTVWWVLYLTVALCIPALIVAAERFGSQPWRSWDFSPAENRTLRRIVIVFFILTMAGYLIWFIHAAHNGFHFSAVSKMLSGTSSQGSTNKSQITTISGVTSMTQFGIPLVIIGCLTWPSASRDVRIMTGIVVAIGLYRALAGSERLAIYELAVPVLIIFAARFYTAPIADPLRRRRRRAAIRVMPFVLLPLLILSFAGFEYTRSWSYYRHHTTDNFLVYETKRLGGYYSTTYNNVQMMRDFSVWPQPGAVPFITVFGVWNFPLFRNVVRYDKLTGANFFNSFNNGLTRYANPEFNNFGGITNATFDYGWLGGAIYTALFGALIGASYASFAQRRRPGLLFYPMVMVGLLELPREGYLTSPRAAPALAGALVAAMALRRVRHHEERRAQRSDPSTKQIGFKPAQPAARPIGPPPVAT